jgi:hypothetical protein
MHNKSKAHIQEYNRQEYGEQNYNGLPLHPVLEEQLKIPIVQIADALRQGKTIKVAIKTVEGFFLSAENGGGGYLYANATTIGPNETFFLIPQGIDREKIVIRTAKENYVRAVDGGGGTVDASSNNIGTNEQFILVPIRPDKFSFITNKNYFLLALTDITKLLTAYGLAEGPRTTFTVIPQIE